MKKVKMVLITLVFLFILSFKITGDDFSITYVTEVEPALELEDWMINSNVFDTFQYEEEKDKPLELEGWMTNTNIWNKN